MVREGVLFYVLVTALVFCGIGVLGTFVLRPVSESLAILASLPRLSQVGIEEFSATIPGTPAPAEPERRGRAGAAGDAGVISWGRALSAADLQLRELVGVLRPAAEMDTLASVEVKAEETFSWRKRPERKSPFGEDAVDRLYMRNRGVEDATVRVVAYTDVVYPEVRAVVVTAVALFERVLAVFPAARIGAATVGHRAGHVQIGGGSAVVHHHHDLGTLLPALVDLHPVQHVW